MIPLLWHYLKSFFFDQKFAKRLLLGLVGALGGAVATMMAFGPDAIMAWTPRELAKHAAVALAPAIFAMLPGPKLAKPVGTAP